MLGVCHIVCHIVCVCQLGNNPHKIWMEVDMWDGLKIGYTLHSHLIRENLYSLINHQIGNT